MGTVITRRLSLALLVAAATTHGCASPGTGEPWVYGLSRGFYASMFEPTAEPSIDHQGTEHEALLYAILLAAPFAIDTVLLPVTLPHDLIWVD